MALAAVIPLWITEISEIAVAAFAFRQSRPGQAKERYGYDVKYTLFLSNHAVTLGSEDDASTFVILCSKNIHYRSEMSFGSPRT